MGRSSSMMRMAEEEEEEGRLRFFVRWGAVEEEDKGEGLVR